MGVQPFFLLLRNNSLGLELPASRDHWLLHAFPPSRFRSRRNPSILVSTIFRSLYVSTGRRTAHGYGPGRTPQTTFFKRCSVCARGCENPLRIGRAMPPGYGIARIVRNGKRCGAVKASLSSSGWGKKVEGFWETNLHRIYKLIARNIGYFESYIKIETRVLYACCMRVHISFPLNFSCFFFFSFLRNENTPGYFFSNEY